MTQREYHVFKKNTEAIATNRGFYYQYLVTIELWLRNFVNGNDSEIYCEYEDDIFQINHENQTRQFHQIKCYTEGFGLNCPEVKSSLLNFYQLYLKHQDHYTDFFYFQTNAFFKPKAGKSLKEWYNKQQKGDFTASEFLEEVRNILLELVQSSFDDYVIKQTEPSLISQAQHKLETFKNQIESTNFLTFLESIRWKFAGESDTDNAIKTSIKKIKGIINHYVDYDQSVDENILFACILETVVSRSTQRDHENRLLNNDLLQKIINNGNFREQLQKQLRPEILLLLQNDFLIIDTLSEIKSDVKAIRDAVAPQNNTNNPIVNLSSEVINWLKAQGYTIEADFGIAHNSAAFIINIPNRRGYDRIYITCVAEAVELNHFNEVEKGYKSRRCDEGWIVTYRRISETVRNKCDSPEYPAVFCYTLDELIEVDTDFSQYFSWLENEVLTRKIDSHYIPLKCKKDVFDKERNETIDTNENILEQYMDEWLEDPAKNHISVLGEFGTGKTWFTLHYAYTKLQEYKRAKEQGKKRPRVPILIPLRDFAKAVNIEGVFSEFFFRKHNSPIHSYDAFVELNKMGKLLLIFDGFDEMADKMDNQKMINNFWELAKAITTNSKVILTCRNEHFPDARKGRALLNAELQASTQHLIVETPQFEVLDLLKFSDAQIQMLLGFFTTPDIVKLIMADSDLLDLARRPVMIDLILESLNDISEGKPVDISRIYLYAIRKKLTKDIKEERTFTSIPDKLYFLCELAWEMLSTNNMSINYRLFPDRIRSLFNSSVLEQKDIDHWQYDMMGQTMLIRNDEGDYKPAHRSLLEFLVAYKFAAELGLLANDFTEFAYGKGNQNDSLTAGNYCWDEYFKASSSLKLKKFKQLDLTDLKETFGKELISRAVIDLMSNIISIGNTNTIKTLTNLIDNCKGRDFDEIHYTATNLVILIVNYNSGFFVNKDLSNLVLRKLRLPLHVDKNEHLNHVCTMIFKSTNFSYSDLLDANFRNPFFIYEVSAIKGANFQNAQLDGFRFQQFQTRNVTFYPTEGLILLSSMDEAIFLRLPDLLPASRVNIDGDEIFASDDGTFVARTQNQKIEIFGVSSIKKQLVNYRKNKKLEFLFTENEHEDGLIHFVKFSEDNTLVLVGIDGFYIYVYETNTGALLNKFDFVEHILKIDISSNNQLVILSNNQQFEVYDLWSSKYIYKQNTPKNKSISLRFVPDSTNILVSHSGSFSLFNPILNELIWTKAFTYKVIDFCLSSNGTELFVLTKNTLFRMRFNEPFLNDAIGYLIKNESNSRLIEWPLSFHLVESHQLIIIVFSYSVASFDLKTNKIIGEFENLGCLDGTNFINAQGLSEQLKCQLKLNGAIVS